MRRLDSSRAPMRAAVALAGAAAAAIILSGCTGEGLSPREVRGQDYATYAFAMQDPSAPPARSTQGSATATAETDVTLATIPEWNFKPFLKEHPEVAYRLLQTLSRRVRQTEAEV